MLPHQHSEGAHAVEAHKMGRGAAKLENPWAAPAPAPTLVDDAVVKEAEPEFRRVNLSCKWRDRVIELPGLDESLTSSKM